MRFLNAVVLWLVCMASLQAQITVVPTVKHLTSTSTPNAGTITLNVSGGTSPYSYTWTPGPTYTQNITNKAKNTYVVKVKDSAPTTLTYTYNIGYKADWDQMYGCISRNDSLIADGSHLWSQAITKNNLASSTNGFVEYILKGMTDTKTFGVLDSLSPLPNTPYTDIDYGYYYDGPNNNLYEVIYGTLYNVASGYTEGTALRVERSGSTVKFVVNGATTHTVSDAVAASKVWKMKAAIYGNVGASFVNMGCSFSTKGGVTFKNYSHLIPFTVHSAGSGLNDGSIRVKPLKTGTYTYTWQPGPVTSATITSKPAGQYTLSAKDATNTITPESYKIGYKVKWDQPYACDIKHDTLMSNHSDSWGSAISKNTLQGGTDGWFEYVLRDLDQYRIIGFTDSLSPRVQDIYDIDFGFYYEAGNLYTFGSSGYLTPLVYNAREGTVLRVEKRGDTLEGKINGVSQGYIVDAALASRDLKVKGTVYGAYNSSLINVGCSFYTQGNGSFPNYTRLIPTITHATHPTSNDGGISISPVQSGTYTYTWQPGAGTGTSIASKAPGNYSVTVEEALNHENTVDYNIAYKVAWDRMNGSLLKHDTLIYDVASGISWGTAISKNTLAAGTDGWIEYVFKEPADTWEVGFLDSLSNNVEDVFDTDYGFYYEGSNGRLYVMTNGYNIYMGTFYPPVGSVLRIERVADTIRFKMNGYSFGYFVDSVSTLRNWKVKGMVYAGNTSSLINVGCSFYQQGYTYFPNYTRLEETIVHSSGTGANDGSVKIQPKQAGTYDYTWQPGSVKTDHFTSRPAGTYTVLIEDSLHHTNEKMYEVGYKALWDSLQGTTATLDTLKGSGTYTWGRAMSKNMLAGGNDGWLSYKVGDPLEVKFIGFIDSLSPLPDDYGDLDYGFYCFGNGYLYSVVNGAMSLAGFYKEGTNLKIERKSDTIRMKVDGFTVATYVDSVESAKNWRVKGILGIYTVDPTLANVGCSFSGDNLLSVNPTITNFTDDAAPGRIDLHVNGGKPHYNIAWNSLKIEDNHDYFLSLDTAFSSIDSLALYPRLDSLRRAQSLRNIPSAIYNNIIMDNAGDTIRETALVGTNFDWITSGVTTNTCVIPPDTASGFMIHYGTGQHITKTAPGTALNYAVSDRIIHPMEREFYTEYRILRDSDEMILGFKTADTLNVDTVTDMIQNTMVHMRGNGTNSMRIYYNSTLVHTADYYSNDVIGILLDPLGHQIVYTRNFTPVWTQTAVPDAFYQVDYQLKALLKTPAAQLGNMIIVGPTLPKKQISATITDVTCGSLSSGVLAFSAYSMLVGELPCSYTVTGPNTYSASGSAAGATLTGLYAGVYTVTVQMRSGSCSGTILSPMVQTFTVGYMPDWINQAPFGSTNVNVTDRSFNITATQASPFAWPGGASTDNMLEAGAEGWAEFKPVFSGSPVSPFSNRAMAFGLNNQDQGTHPSDNDHGFYVASNIQLLFTGLGNGSSQSVGPYTASMFSLGTIGSLNTVSPTDILKIRKVSVSSGLNMKMEFYKNNIQVGTSNTIPSTELVADVSVNQKDLFISKPRITFGCEKKIPYYFILKKILDAGYYTSYRKSIYFAFEEEYFDPAQGSSGSLSYTLVTDKNVPVSAPGRVEAIGDNRYTIDLSAVSGMVQGDFYRIAITNKKNEVFYARFKY